ncbi:hypothetical protein GZH53_04360 [Flavihumibacter sp. R14]|nr:hypothetical protein [Flavihumibacter soli]
MILTVRLTTTASVQTLMAFGEGNFLDPIFVIKIRALYRSLPAFMENIIETLVISYGTGSWHHTGNFTTNESGSKQFLVKYPDSHGPQEEYDVRVSTHNYGDTTAYEISPGIRL